MKRGTIALVLASLTAVGCSEPVQLRKQRLINAIRQTLLESVEAEKSAVLATTDEESQTLVKESQRFTAEIDRMRGELRELIVAGSVAAEVKALDDFDAAWAEFENVDQRLLALAVANTNLKATRLSAEEGTAALERFVDAVTAMQAATADAETIRALSRTSVAALRINSLLLTHIPTAGETEMTRLEQQIEAASGEVDRSLAAASGQLEPKQVAAATQAWADYRRILADVVRLSRQNTNVISFDVSVHEKRKATKDCLAALNALSEAVESGKRATR